MLRFKSLFIAFALLAAFPAASASNFRKWTQWKSSSKSADSVLEYMKSSVVVVNVQVYARKDPSGLYQGKVKRVYKGCELEQYDTILIDVGSGDSYNGCASAVLAGNYRYLLFGHVGHRDKKTVLTLTTCAPATRFDRLISSDRQTLQNTRSGSCEVHNDKTTYNEDSYGCSIKDCGLLPYNSSPIHCPDGSTAGFTNKCIDVKGKCQWEILECPVCDCGSPKPTYKCHDGKKVGGEPLECKTSSKGSCSWIYSECAPCKTDDDCVAIENGICREGTCERAECSEHSDCEDNEVCEDGYCVECACKNSREEFLCHDGKTYGNSPELCTRKYGRCEFTYSECAPCKTNGDCTGLDYGICKDGQCEESECYDSGDCDNNEVCEHGICKACECEVEQEPYKCHDHKTFGGEPYDCKLTDYGKCKFSYTDCKDCLKDVDCSALGDKGVCKDGQCSLAQCLNDQHCADDEFCEGHHCVKCDCGDPDESFLCHDKVKYGNEPEECKRRENGKCSWSYSECAPCSDDGDCSALSNGVCKDGECSEAECRDSEDCADDEFCEYHQCVKCDCGRSQGKSRCPDGINFSGSDKCIFDDGSCKWTVKTCPVPTCDHDYDCDHGLYCVDGHCSATQPYKDVCQSDDDCDIGEYCAAGKCLEVGACKSRDDCYNPSNDFEFDLDKNCKEPRLDCSYGACKASCCSNPTNCYVEPCKSQTCKDTKLASCDDDYCGACKARFFTHDGSPTCLSY